MADVFSQCGPRIIDVSNSCDGSLTKADIQGLTPETMENLKDTAYMEFFLYRQTTMARMSGVKELSLWDLLMSKISNVKGELAKQPIGKNKSFFLPYFMREQEDYINANAFKVVAGQADPDAGTTVGGVYHPIGSWAVTIQGSDSPWYTQIKNIERYCLPGEYAVVLNLSGSSTVTEPYYKIISSVNATSGGVEKATVVLAPNVTDAKWSSMTAAERLPFQVTQGVVQLGANSVSDYESWCYNQPADLSRRMIAFWPQTMRYTRCWDDQYADFIKRIFEGDVNPYLERFKELPMSEQNRKMYAIYQRKMLNTFWYGQAIDENQTVEGYRNLPKVRDPRGNLSFIEYKANAIGVREQLRGCNRLVDNLGARLDINALEEQLYALKRHREVDGGSVDSIDVMTDKSTANRLKTLFNHYYKARYGMSLEKNSNIGQKITFGQQTMWNYNSYELDEAQVMLNVIVDPFFADHKAHFTGGLASRGNMLVALDWNDVSMGIGGVNRRVSKTPDIESDPDFKCIIEANITHTEMESTKMTPIIEDPSRHLIIENFSDECPVYTYEDCAATS